MLNLPLVSIPLFRLDRWKTGTKCTSNYASARILGETIWAVCRCQLQRNPLIRVSENDSSSIRAIEEKMIWPMTVVEGVASNRLLMTEAQNDNSDIPWYTRPFVIFRTEHQACVVRPLGW
jgi:hypothetical protein